MSKNISKNLSSKYSQKLQNHIKQSEQFKKTAKATFDLIGNKNAVKITKVSKTSPQSNSEIVTYETENITFNKKILKERYISLKNRKLLMIQD